MSLRLSVDGKTIDDRPITDWNYDSHLYQLFNRSHKPTSHHHPKREPGVVSGETSACLSSTSTVFPHGGCID